MNDKPMIEWFKMFEEISRGQDWSEEETSEILKCLILDPAAKDVLNGSKYDSIREQILKIRYPINILENDMRVLQQVRQKDFVLIKDLLKKVEAQLEIISFKYKYSKAEYKRRYEELVLQSLSELTKDELVKRNLKSFEEIISYLEDLENSILCRLNAQGIIGSKRQEKWNIKWCRNCHLRNHNTNEYYSNKNKTNSMEKKNNKSFDPSMCNIILKETNLYDVISLNVLIGKNKYVAIIDTGSNKNLINSRIAKNEEWKIVLENKVEFKFGNGNTLTTKQKITENIEIANLNLRTKEDFFLIENLPSDLILGQEFLINNKLILNYNSLTIGHKGSLISMNNECGDQIQRDSLVEKCLISANEVLDEETKTLINEYKQKNEEFKVMKIPEKKIEVETNKEIKIINKKYSLPFKYLEPTRKELKRLIAEEIIEVSDNLFTSPGFVIPKKNGEIRLVVDYRELNTVIKDDIDIIPKINDLMPQLSEAVVFTKIDLKNGFNQIPIKENSRKLTTFSMLGNTYQYRRVPFGIKSGPKIFQRTINFILNGISNIIVYIDDILIYAKTAKEHNKILKMVLERLKKFHVKNNFEKSTFGTKEVEMLGLMIKQKEIRPSVLSLNKLTEKLDVKRKRDIQKVIGTLNWYRNFIPNFSMKIKSLTDKLKDDGQKIELSKFDKENVEKIIKEINEFGILKFPNFTEEFNLQTDASEFGIGGILYQSHGVIGFFSKKLNETEVNYSIVEKEMFAIIKGLEHFKNIITGFKIKIYCDNRNCLFTPKNNNARMIRWKLLLNEYNFSLEAIEGRRNIIADALSRRKIALMVKANEQDNLQELVREAAVVEKNGQKVFDGRGRVFIDDTKKKEFIRKMHERSVHAGMSTLDHNLKNYYKIGQLRKTIEAVIKDCVDCKRSKKNTYKNPQNKSIIAKKAFEKICSDIFGPFQYGKGKEKKKGYLLTLIDVYSRFTRVYLIKDITDIQVIKSIKCWIKEFEKPKIIITDNGKQYTSRRVKNFCKYKKIELRYTPKYHPQSNGICERTNSIMVEVLRIYRGWPIKDLIKKIETRLNKNYRRTIGGAPIEFINGLNHYNPARNVKMKTRKEDVKEYNSDVDIDKQIGKHVLVKNFTGNKTEDVFIGPYVITARSQSGRWFKLGGIKEWIHKDHIKS